MKIVFLCNEYPPHVKVGGIGIFTKIMARGLVDAGHKVTVLGYGRKNIGEWNDEGVRVVTLSESKIRGISWFLNRRRLYSWLKKHARAQEIDVIEIPEYQGMLPFNFSLCPVVVRLHTSFSARQKIQRILEKRTLSKHRKWIAVSEWIGKETIKKFNLTPSNISVIYNPVIGSSPEITIPFELPDNFVLYAGTLSELKGAFVLAEAARSFLTSNPDLHLVFIGDIIVENGQYSDETILKITGDQFAGRVHFTGHVEHEVVLACMKRARVFAFPSKLETFGLVAVEAMSCGTPVVYSTLHSGPEVIDNGITGLLADPYSPKDVAEKVMSFLNNRKFSDRIVENAKRAVKERFLLQRSIDKTIAFYNFLLSANKQKIT